MSPEFLNLTIYLSLGLIFYYYFMEMYKNQGAQRYIAIIILGGFLLFLIWWWYQYQQIEEDEIEEHENTKYSEEKGNEEKLKSSTTTESIPECPKQIDIPQDFRYIDNHLRLKEERTISKNLTTYEEFKKWYQDPEYIAKYKMAVEDALYLQKKKLYIIKKKWLEDMKAVSVKDKDMKIYEGTLDRLDEAKNIKNNIVIIDRLIVDINKRIETLSTEVVKKNLYSAVNDPTNGIESLTGRAEIKDFLALQLYTFSQNPKIFFSNFQNLAIYGKAGVGKTKLAQVIGHVYSSSGMLIRNHTHIVTKKAFTTAYVNESGRMTHKLLMSNLGSVVFIDEAYSMTPPDTIFGKSTDHGNDAIEEMINFLDKMMGLSIIIVAGYEEEMENRFMKANQGLPRRFPRKLILTPYTNVELSRILLNFLSTTCSDLKINKKHADIIYTAICQLTTNDPTIFKNQAGDMNFLAGHISQSIYGSMGLEWPKDDEQLILIGFNKYLESFNKSITL